MEIILLLKKKPGDYKQKIDALKKAMNDALFLNDLKEVADDFENIDLEEWQEPSWLTTLRLRLPKFPNS